MLHRLATLNADNFDRLALCSVPVTWRSESPADAGHGARLVGDHVFDRELRRGTPMGRTNDLLESVWTMEGHPATTLMVEVRGGNVLMAVVRVACGERRHHPSNYASCIGFGHSFPILSGRFGRYDAFGAKLREQDAPAVACRGRELQGGWLRSLDPDRVSLSP